MSKKRMKHADCAAFSVFHAELQSGESLLFIRGLSRPKLSPI